jgi:hypothetical protein
MKTPRTFGVELEGFTDEDLVGDAIYSADGSVRFRGTGDGSLSSAYGNDVELVSPPLDETDYINDIYETLQCRYGWRVNNTAGLHIHVDALGYRARDFYKLLLFMVAVEPLIYTITNEYRFHNCGYAKAMTRFHNGVQRVFDRDFDEISRNYEAFFTDDRYVGLNFDAFDEHGTVEFRYFAPQKEPEKVVKYIELVTKIVEFVKDASIDQIRVIVKDLIQQNFDTLASRLVDILDLSYNLAECRENHIFEHDYIRNFSVDHVLAHTSQEAV